MRNYAFKTVVENQIERSRNILLEKSKEYSSSTDRLHNFRVAASLRGVSEKKALGGMMSKHTVSIYDMIGSDEDYPIHIWDEKITDHINYLLLLRALVEEGARDENYQDGPDFPEMNYNESAIRGKLTTRDLHYTSDSTILSKEDLGFKGDVAPNTVRASADLAREGEPEDLRTLDHLSAADRSRLAKLQETYPGLKVEHYIPLEERQNARKQKASGVLEGRGREGSSEEQGVTKEN